MNTNGFFTRVKNFITKSDERRFVFLTDEEMRERGFEYQMSYSTYRDVCDIFAGEVQRLADSDDCTEEVFWTAVNLYMKVRTKTYIYD